MSSREPMPAAELKKRMMSGVSDDTTRRASWPALAASVIRLARSVGVLKGYLSEVRPAPS